MIENKSKNSISNLAKKKKIKATMTPSESRAISVIAIYLAITLISE
jgi:hypothetical protein